MTHPLLQVQNLSINFTSGKAVNTAVQNISFTVHSGQILAIVGESGSGKSVTALSLLQLLPRQALVKGELLFASGNQQRVDLLKTSGRQMNTIRGKDIAMIFQEPMTSLNPVITCGKQVMESIQLHQHISSQAARQKTIELFEQTDLPNPAELILQEKVEFLFSSLRKEFDYVIIDTPPVGLVTDALLLSKYSDANLYVVRQNFTLKEDAS